MDSCLHLPSLLDITIEQVAEGLKSGHFRSVDLVKAYLARIEEASAFNAVLQINPDALGAAKQLDDERIHSGPRGPLHGVPILVKDNIVTEDKLEASAGSCALYGSKPAIESSLVSKLRAAGVIILGKSNLSEWANFRGVDIPSGWSPRGGQTWGTYYPKSTPEGSSSGSAVGAALGLCVAALGTETAGSITAPAQYNNVVGFKPTRGLIAADGVVPISMRQDVIGTLTRTVKDASYLFSGMAGRSEMDERTWNIPIHLKPIPDFTTFCKDTDLSGINIGIPRNSFDSKSPKPIMDSFESALKILISAGANVVDKTDFPGAEEFKKFNKEVKGVVLAAEFKRDVMSYLETLETNPNALHSMEDIINFTKVCPEEMFPEYDIGKFMWTQDVDINSDRLDKIFEQELYFAGEGGVLGAMETYNLDVLVIPCNLGVADVLAAKLGFPIISVPLGFWPEGTPIEYEDCHNGTIEQAPGIPYGISFIARAFSDGTLLHVAHAFEQLTAVREKGPRPFMVPNTELKEVLQAV